MMGLIWSMVLFEKLLTYFPIFILEKGYSSEL